VIVVEKKQSAKRMCHFFSIPLTLSNGKTGESYRIPQCFSTQIQGGFIDGVIARIAVFSLELALC